jgi:hypothetical protein
MSKVVHRLKTWPSYFRAIDRGEKRFEVRRDDRGFDVGHEVVLEEYEPGMGGVGFYTGAIFHGVITYVMRGSVARSFGVDQGVVVLSIRKKRTVLGYVWRTLLWATSFTMFGAVFQGRWWTALALLAILVVTFFGTIAVHLMLESRRAKRMNAR